MFWESVVIGLNTLTFWETYVAALEYLVIYLVPMFIVGVVMEKSERVGATVGCLGMLVLPLFQVAAMIVFILSLAPIILGIGTDAAWSFPWEVLIQAPGTFLKLVAILAVGAILMAFLPILGRISTLHTLVLGGIALVFVIELILSMSPSIVRGRIDYIPGFWFSVGILVVGGILSWIGMMLAALVSTLVYAGEDGMGKLFLPLFGAVLGFIPVFIYGAWLGAQMRGGY